MSPEKTAFLFSGQGSQYAGMGVSVEEDVSPPLPAITVHAEEDWMIPVKIIPTIIPMKRFVVKISRIRRSLAPATFSMESLINSIPNRNSPRPPAIVNIVPKLIFNPSISLDSLPKNQNNNFQIYSYINNPKYILRDRIKTCNVNFTFLLLFFTKLYAISTVFA